MEVTYDHKVDALYIELTKQPVAGTKRINPNFAVDVDAQGEVVGIEILNARKSGIDPLTLTAAQFTPDMQAERVNEDGIQAGRTAVRQERSGSIPKQEKKFIPIYERGYKPYLGTLGLRDIVKDQNVKNGDYDLYGDESTANELVVYGIVAVHTDIVDQTIRQYHEIIQSFDLPANTRLHCRELFSPKGRAKSIFNEMKEKQIWELVNQMAAMMKSNDATYYLGVAHRKTYPDSFPSASGKTVRLTSEHLYAIAYITARTVVQATLLTHSNISAQIWADIQTNKLEFPGIGRKTIQELMHVLYRDEREIAVQKVVKPKPILLDIADLFAYVSARAESENDSPYKKEYLALFDIFSPQVADIWWNPQRDAWIPPQWQRRFQISS